MKKRKPIKRSRPRPVAKKLTKRKVSKKRISKNPVSLAEIKQNQTVYYGKQPVRIAKIRPYGIETESARVIPFNKLSKVPPPTLGNSGLKIGDKTTYSKHVPLYRKVYLYEQPLGDLLKEELGQNLILVIYVSTLLNGHKEEIPNNYVFDIDIINKYDTVVRTIRTPEGIKYKSHDDAVRAALVIFRERTSVLRKGKQGIHIPFHNIRLIRHDIIPIEKYG